MYFQITRLEKPIKGYNVLFQEAHVILILEAIEVTLFPWRG